MKAKWISHSLRGKYFLKHCIEGNVERKRWRERRRKQLLDGLEEEDILEFERGNTIYHCLGNSLWRRLWTCRKTE